MGVDAGVPGRAHKRSTGEAALPGCHFLRNTEVDEIDAPILIQHDILGLDVPVNDVSRMNLLKDAQQLSTNLDDEGIVVFAVSLCHISQI